MTGHKKYIQFSGNMVQSPLEEVCSFVYVFWLVAVSGILKTSLKKFAPVSLYSDSWQ